MILKKKKDNIIKLTYTNKLYYTNNNVLFIATNN